MWSNLSFNIYLYDVCSLILTEPYTKYRNLVKKTSCLRLIYHAYILFGVVLKWCTVFIGVATSVPTPMPLTLIVPNDRKSSYVGWSRMLRVALICMFNVVYTYACLHNTMCHKVLGDGSQSKVNVNPICREKHKMCEIALLIIAPR